MKSLMKNVFWATLLMLLLFCAAEMVDFRKTYVTKYEDAYNQMLIEHDRQLVIGQILLSKRAWQKAANTLQVAYLDERAKYNQLASEAYDTRMKTYMFFKILDKKYPGVKEDILEQMDIELIPQSPLGLKSNEPTPALPKD